MDQNLQLSQKKSFAKLSIIYVKGEGVGEVVMTAKASSREENAKLVQISIDRSQRGYWQNNKVLEEDKAHYLETGDMYVEKKPCCYGFVF